MAITVQIEKIAIIMYLYLSTKGENLLAKNFSAVGSFC